MRISDWSSDVCSSDLPCWVSVGAEFIASALALHAAAANRKIPAGCRKSLQLAKSLLCINHQQPRYCGDCQIWHGRCMITGNTQHGRASRRERVCKYV